MQNVSDEDFGFGVDWESSNLTDAVPVFPPIGNESVYELADDEIPGALFPSARAVTITWFYIAVFLLCAAPRRVKKGEEADPDERRRLIKGALLTRRIGAGGPAEVVAVGGERGGGAIGDAAAPAPGAEEEDGAAAGAGAAEDGSPANADASACAVCLEPFRSGEEVSWSRDLRCRHVFHLGCVTEWLMRHDDCPCCRAEFIPPLEAPQGADDPSGEGGGSASGSDSDEDSAHRRSGLRFFIVRGLISQQDGARLAGLPLFKEFGNGAFEGEALGAKGVTEEPQLGGSCDNLLSLLQSPRQTSSTERYAPLDNGRGEAGDAYGPVRQP